MYRSTKNSYIYIYLFYVLNIFEQCFEFIEPQPLQTQQDVTTLKLPGFMGSVGVVQGNDPNYAVWHVGILFDIGHNHTPKESDYESPNNAIRNKKTKQVETC